MANKLAEEHITRIQHLIAGWMRRRKMSATLAELWDDTDDDAAEVTSWYDDADEPGCERPNGPTSSRFVWLGDDIGPDEIEYFDNIDSQDCATAEDIITAIRVADQCRATDIAINASPNMVKEIARLITEGDSTHD